MTKPPVPFSAYTIVYQGKLYTSCKEAATVNNHPINVVRETVYKKKKKKD